MKKPNSEQTLDARLQVQNQVMAQWSIPGTGGRVSAHEPGVHHLNWGGMGGFPQSQLFHNMQEGLAG